MANVNCYEEYCESTLNREDGLKMTFGEEATIISGFVLVTIVYGVLLWYEVSLRNYLDPAYLSQYMNS